MVDIIEEDKRFLASQLLDDYNPVIEFVDYPVTVIDKIVDDIKKCSFSRFYSYTVWNYNLKQFVCHTYAARTTKTYGVEVKEVRRDFETYPSIFRDMYYCEYGCNRGSHVVWNKIKGNYYRGEIKPNKEWTILPQYYFDKMGHCCCQELNTIENVIVSDMSLRYFGYKNNTWYFDLLDYIKLYRKEPIVETFMKLGLKRFITNPKAIEFTNNNKVFRKWLYANYEQCQEMAFQTVRNAFKKNPNGSVSDYYKSLMYRIECGRELAFHDKEIYEYALKFANQEKMYQYISDMNINTSSYFDYLKACQWLQLDFNDTKVMFPKDFQTYHDEYIRQYADWKNEQALKEAAEKGKAISEKMLKTADKYNMYNFTGAAYLVVVAKSKCDLINEGSKLNHCVGRMNYDERQAKEQSMICFVRKVDDPNTPYVTVELGLEDFKIKQCYGHHDSKPDEETLDFVNNIWLTQCNKLRKRVFASA